MVPQQVARTLQASTQRARGTATRGRNNDAIPFNTNKKHFNSQESV